MTVEHSGGSQPARVLAMLWRHHRPAARPANGKPALGRPPTLTLDAVISAAIELADTEGLATMSMGRVAKALGVGTMTLYTYVPSKDELLDLMIDQVYLVRELPRSGPELPESWRDRVELYAAQTLAMYGRHDWLCEVSFIRPPIGPGMLDAREFLLAALSGIGLEPVQVDSAALAISTYVEGAAGIQADSARIERRTGQSNDAWWGERNDLWETYFDVERYPAMTALWHAGGFNRNTAEAAAHSYRFGLDRLLDGIDALIPKP